MAKWQQEPPEFTVPVLGPNAYYWVIWDWHYPKPILVAVYCDDEVGYRVVWDGRSYSPHPEDYALWYPEPVIPPQLPVYDPKEVEKIRFPDGKNFDPAHDRTKIGALLK